MISVRFSQLSLLMNGLYGVLSRPKFDRYVRSVRTCRESVSPNCSSVADDPDSSTIGAM